MLVYGSVFCIRKKWVEGLKRKTNTEHALDYWQVVTNHILKCHAKPVVSLIIRNNLTLWGWLPHGNAQSNLYSLVWNLKNILLLEFCSKNISDTPKTETHTLCVFFFGIQSSQETPSKCHLYPPNVRFWPRPNRSRCLEKKYHKHVLPPPPKKKNENTASFSWSLFRTTKHLLAMRALVSYREKQKQTIAC